MPRSAAIALTIVALSVFLSPLRRELYVGDETKYSQVVREMRAGAFFVPTLHGSPFTHKPPLHFWIVDALTYPFGVYSVWPFVLPSLLGFLGLLWLMKRWIGPMAAFVCGTSLLIWGSAQTARMDVPFTLLLAYAAWRIWRADGALPFPAGVATGIAALVKGPMAPVITLALFAFESIRRRRKPRAGDFPALLPMIVIPLLWLVPALMIGGEAFWREIFFKQTVGRAVGAWVHKSPPWFYLVRAPLTLIPWFFLCVAAIVAAYRRKDELAKFGVSWILAVLVPYTLLSSKLDVYMITLLPAVALVIARFVDAGDEAWGRRANLIVLSLFALIGAAGLFVQPEHIKEEDGALVARLDVRLLFAILLVASLAAAVITLRGRLVSSTLATGLVLPVTLGYAALVLVPIANELASTRPLVRALVRQNAPAGEIGLYVCPHLWTRDMPPELWRARHLQREEVGTTPIVVVRRRNAAEVAEALRGYQKVDELRMIGKWFDVYRR
jgi:4-amino-4-deoxy-L-arabinose transferase-like glycosyltransferase